MVAILELGRRSLETCAPMPVPLTAERDALAGSTSVPTNGYASLASH